MDSASALPAAAAAGPGFAPECRRGRAYDEQAFRYFLGTERALADRTRSPMVLVLVNLANADAGARDIAPDVAASLFAGLGACLRTTDVVGWFRERRIIGAFLTPSASAPAAAVVELMRDKVWRNLARSLPGDQSDRVRIRAYYRPCRPERGT